ncbi:MAG: DNA-directed RNA polymerase subunit beta' [Bacilli bacterium]
MDVNNFDAMKIALASPDKIRNWSHGEVKKPETINYRTLKPEKDGLFCEKIFGPAKDWECNCGKYKKVRFKGIICDKCGVEVTRAKVRRERLGHIELAAPVSHIWYLKSIPSRLGLILDIAPRDLEEVVYFVTHIVIEPGAAPLEKKQLLSDKEYRAYYEKYGRNFKAGQGAEAIKALLEQVDLESERDDIQLELKRVSGQKRNKLLKRLEVVDAFVKSGNKPEWLILDVLPVIPPELRPMIQLDGGRFATSDLNDLYRRVINRNNRLKRLLEIHAPQIIVQNEKRMLQEAVDALLDNGRRGRAVAGAGNRPLKSLTHMLKGKQGRFRQNLLGKRVDYSGRSVIVVGPDLKMYQCGLPKEMALELFKPHIIKELTAREIASTTKSAKKLIDSVDECVWDVVEDIIKEHPVLLNRAPTLHRLGIQAFEPKLIDGRAIRLHPLVTTAFNADFDGDQMAVHVPLSVEAQTEARLLMLSSNNILNPKDGKPVVTPSQDMVLGNYYLTMEVSDPEREGNVYLDADEVSIALQNDFIHLHTRIILPAKSLNNLSFTKEQNESYIVTTPGKLIFNSILSDSFPYINEPTEENLQQGTPYKYFYKPGTNFKEELATTPIVEPFRKKILGRIIAEIFAKYKTTETSRMLDELKDLGLKYSTIAGMTFSIDDVLEIDNKEEIISISDKEVDKIQKQFERGLITDIERYAKVVDVWTKTKDEIYDRLKVVLDNVNFENSIYMLMDSGARGNINHFGQLAGMRGLMAKPTGEPIEIPIKSSFIEGLTVSEFFTSTHGARKGLADRALKTANSGYLTRRLVDVTQDVILQEVDCGTELGLKVADIIDTRDGKIIENLYDRLLGRYINQDITDNSTGDIIISKGEFIDEEIANKIINNGNTEVEIRSVLTCDAKNGICTKCYGRNLATGEIAEVGETVGIIAAQSIGEPGTQLTMRTFQTGGVASADDITQGLPRVEELFEARNPKGCALITEISGKVIDIITLDGERYEIIIKNNIEEKKYLTQYGSRLRVAVNDEVYVGQKLTSGNIDPKELIKATDILTVQNYIVKEIQKVYRSQGVEISDKHIEVVARKMNSRIRIIESGNSEFLDGSLVSVREFTDRNNETLLKGKVPAIGRPVVLGITKASLETDSFLSAASFQETTKVLTDAAIRGKIDRLEGLKENVIIGKVIPAGTGAKFFKNTIMQSNVNEDYTEEILTSELPIDSEFLEIPNENIEELF